MAKSNGNAENIKTPGSENNAGPGEDNTPLPKTKNDPDAIIEVKQSTLDQLQAQIDSVNAKLLNANKPKLARQSEADLPEQEDIKEEVRKKMKHPVLTKQGWLVPDDLGMREANKR